ncbi:MULTISPECIES: histidinol dehydrogenase [Thalassospira]|jgi:histidinol dehydrogenase|uniref:histidinol dehydrogenase n=1 Tax=Thalassospira TaxID=168934 RepID=UPI000A1FE7E3|nr:MULTISPECIES: histidinol dehydrogenase [Thalassospira]MBO9505960.1 histidinol dehydrogenase [Thalassospira sp. A3_1]MCH2276173.1 histidinol dehydrogenase [Thalassospira sp.]MCK2167396.1 histidinol dehydrogenase [Thalassospira xiamenensis]OSQ30636.1 histidinol dehydrogenase [Thalassospira sp. MCCC 1A03138]RCK32133.1 histidinol dehydrogenase [Thalassospira xiamenensis]
MPIKLSITDADFEDGFVKLLGMKRESDADVDVAVANIIADVRKRGDIAVCDYTNKFDRLNIDAAGMVVTREEVDAAVAAIDADLLKSLELAAERIRSYHDRQMPSDERYTDATGVELGWRWRPVSAAGLYVPGGLASYPSSVLMNAIPAKVAGVERLVMVVPTPDNKMNPLVLAAARIAGVDEIYRIGGAQAIAALAYGTETIKPVDKIVGPGNAFVAAAKRRVFGQVGIDMIAGPSEILVVADGSNDPSWVAADLLSQAEHDPVAQSILITDDADFADRVQEAIDAHLEKLPRAEIAGASWRDFGAIVLVENLTQAPALVDRIAPEHLELAVDDPDALAEDIHHAGAIFLGRYTPEAIGDYVAGPNHVLPTARSARFSSGLGVLDFIKRSSLIKCTPESLAKIGPAAIALAESEGLQAHGLSVAIRSNRM